MLVMTRYLSSSLNSLLLQCEHYYTLFRILHKLDKFYVLVAIFSSNTVCVPQQPELWLGGATPGFPLQFLMGPVLESGFCSGGGLRWLV